jgi:competence protein ComEA
MTFKQSTTFKRAVFAFCFALLLAVSPFGYTTGKGASPVNINTADEVTLAASLKGVGEARARAIVAYRNQHGPFKSVEQLAEVKGIGPAVIEDNRANILLK